MHEQGCLHQLQLLLIGLWAWFRFLNFGSDGLERGNLNIQLLQNNLIQPWKSSREGLPCPLCCFNFSHQSKLAWQRPWWEWFSLWQLPMTSCRGADGPSPLSAWNVCGAGLFCHKEDIKCPRHSGETQKFSLSALRRARWTVGGMAWLSLSGLEWQGEAQAVLPWLSPIGSGDKLSGQWSQLPQHMELLLVPRDWIVPATNLPTQPKGYIRMYPRDSECYLKACNMEHQ